MNGFNTKGAVEDLLERLQYYRNEVSIEAALDGALCDVGTWIRERSNLMFPNPAPDIDTALTEVARRIYDEPPGKKEVDAQ